MHSDCDGSVYGPSDNEEDDNEESLSSRKEDSHGKNLDHTDKVEVSDLRITTSFKSAIVRLSNI